MGLGTFLPIHRNWASNNQVTNPENCNRRRERAEPSSSSSSGGQTSRPSARVRTYQCQDCRPGLSAPKPATRGLQMHLGSGDGDLANAFVRWPVHWIDQDLGLFGCNWSQSTPNALMQRIGVGCYWAI